MTPDQLKALRKSIGLSQEKMALEVGVTVSAYQKWENGINGITEKKEVLIKQIVAKYS